MSSLAFRLFALVWAFWAVFATPAAAQFIPGFSTTQAEPQNETDNLAELMRLARESGVKLIVIDPESDFDPLVDPVDLDVLKQDEMSGLMKAQDGAIQFRKTLRKRLKAMPNSLSEMVYILRASSPNGTIRVFVEALFWSLALFAIGMVAEREIYGKRFARYRVIPKIKDHPIGYSEKLPFLIFRFFMGVIGILVSIVVAYAIGVSIFGESDDTAMQFTVVSINLAYFSCRTVILIWRMVLAPYLCQYRIPHFSNKDALKLYYWLYVITIFDVCSLIFANWVAELGLNYDVYSLVSAFLAFIFAAANVLMVLVNRRAISRAIRNGAPIDTVAFSTRIISTAWVPLVILYVVFAWLQLTYKLILERETSAPQIAGAYGIIISILVVFALVNYTIERLFERTRRLREQADAAAKVPANTTDDLEGYAEIEPAANHCAHAVSNYEDLARRVSGVLAFTAGIWACLQIWDVQMTMVKETKLDRAQDVIVILFIGYILYHTFRIWIDNKIRDEQGDAPEAELGDEGGGASGSRLATLLPLFRNVVLVVIFTSISLIVLLEFGINVSPLFAGAGIVGIAIGFGAQTLVADIFSGAFFLFDDAFRKGEYIDTGEVRGTVEKISLRSIQLRHHRGLLHTIPFSGLRFVTNYSRDWVIMKLPLRVTYDTDVEQVRKLVKKLGLELLKDPLIGPDFLQPLKSQGVIEMQDSAMIIRVKFMTKPGGQWLIRKRVFQEIRDLFAREGIKFAHREVTVRLADGDVNNLTAAQKEAVAAAAAQSVLMDEEEAEAEAKAEHGADDR